MTNILSNLRNDLKNNADDKTKSNYQRFFKEEVKGYGVNLAKVDKIGKKYYFSLKNSNKAEIFSFCEKLFKSNLLEESWIAANWAYELKESFTPSDFKVFENWLEKYVSNWATCDTLCNHTIGAFVEKYPQFVNSLKKWAKSNNHWVRRASAVTLILPARHGKFLDDIFSLANLLLRDADDMVQKGYGWMLKEASKTHQKEVFDFVLKNKKDMPRTALRYAIEKMPSGLRQKAMAK